MTRTVTLVLAAFCALGALAVSGCGGDDPGPAPTPVAELPSAAPPPTHLLEKEREFTHADTAYGRCLVEHGVQDLPPLTEPLDLDSKAPAVADALTACASLAPTPAPS